MNPCDGMGRRSVEVNDPPAPETTKELLGCAHQYESGNPCTAIHSSNDPPGMFSHEFTPPAAQPAQESIEEQLGRLGREVPEKEWAKLKADRAAAEQPAPESAKAGTRRFETWTLHMHGGIVGECVCAGHEMKGDDRIVLVVEQAALDASDGRYENLKWDYDEVKWKLAAETAALDRLQAWQDQIIEIIIAPRGKKNEDAAFAVDRIDRLVSPAISVLRDKLAAETQRAARLTTLLNRVVIEPNSPALIEDIEEEIQEKP